MRALATDTELAAAVRSLPERERVLAAFRAVRDRARPGGSGGPSGPGTGAGAYLVGGAVRDLLLGLAPLDLDVAIEGDALAVAEQIDRPVPVHERFGTATVRLDGRRVDFSATRREHYPHPGALPVVEPGPLADDLRRRDFTINAMAIALDDPDTLIDPHGGRGDLAAGVLRVLHDAAFVDDPTRALRAARYAERPGGEPDAHTLELLRRTDLTTVSAARRDAELRRLAAEPRPGRAAARLAGWGLLDISADRLAALDRLAELDGAPPWSALGAREDAVILLLSTGDSEAAALAREEHVSGARAGRLADGRSPAVLLAARALGAGWLDDWIAAGRHVALQIGGSDLLEAGVARGPDIGAGLAAALDAARDGRALDRDTQLRIALEVARR